MNVHPVFLQCGSTVRSRVALHLRKRYSKWGDGITNISSRKEQVIFSEQWGNWFYQRGSGLSRKSEMKERWSMKALGDQAVGLGNNSVEGMIKSILDCTSHVPNSEPLQLPFFLSGMSCPPSLSVLLFVTVQMSPPLSPVPLENVIGCNYVVPKTFHVSTGTFCACV